MPGTDDIEGKQTQSSSQDAQSNEEDRLINKIRYHGLVEPNSDVGMEEEIFRLGLKARVGICQLIKAEGRLPRQRVLQRGRR